jgi:hypothetical protein
MEYYLFRSFRPQKGPFPRLVPSQLFTIPREIPSLPSFPVRVAEYSIQSNDECTYFKQQGLFQLGIELTTGDSLDECTRILTVQSADNTRDGGKKLSVCTVRYEHPVHGVVLDLESEPGEVVLLGGAKITIADCCNRIKTKLDLDQIMHWLDNITLPFTLYQSPDKTIRFKDLLGEGVVVGRHGMNEGGDYSFYLSENEQERLTVLLCSCFLKIDYPAPDPQVALERKKRRKMAKIKHAELKSKDPKYKARKSRNRMQRKSIETNQDIRGFIPKRHIHIISNLKQLFEYLINKILFKKTNSSEARTKAILKLYTRLFNQFYSLFLEPLHPQCSQSSTQLLSMIASSQHSEQSLAVLCTHLSSSTQATLKELEGGLTQQISASLSSVPPFTDLSSMPLHWREAIDHLELFDVALKVRQMQDKVANFNNGFFWRLNFPEQIWKIFDWQVHALLSSSESKKVKFTGHGFEDYPATIPWGLSFPLNKISLIPSGKYLLNPKCLYQNNGNQYTQLDDSIFTVNNVNAVKILSNEYFCCYKTYWTFQLVLFKYYEDTSLKQLTLSVSFLPQVEPACTHSTVFLVETKDISTVAQVKILCIDLEYLFSKNRIASTPSQRANSTTSKGSTLSANIKTDSSISSSFTYELFDRAKENAMDNNLVDNSTMECKLCPTDNILFLLIACPNFPNKEECLNQIVALEWNVKKKLLEFICKHQSTNFFQSASQQNSASKSIAGMAFTYSRRPYLLYNPLCTQIDVALWTIHRYKLMQIQCVNRSSRIMRLMLGEKVDDDNNNYSLQMNKIAGRMYICIQSKRAKDTGYSGRTTSQPLYTMCRLKLT